MTGARLAAGVEAGALMRGVEAAGGFATVVQRGDADRGALLLIVASRGRHIACLERMLGLDGGYRWTATGPGENSSSADIAAFVARRRRVDPDSWLIELDVAHPEQFIAETTASG